MSCAHLRVEPGRGCLPTARAWVVARGRENGLAPGAVRVVELLTSELVANAVVHAGGPEIVVRAGTRAERFAVSVTDASDTWPVLRSTGPEVPGGHGMRLVERLATVWGVESEPGGGKSVWFQVPLEGRG